MKDFLEESSWKILGLIFLLPLENNAFHLLFRSWDQFSLSPAGEKNAKFDISEEIELQIISSDSVWLPPFWCLSLIGQIPSIFSSDWSMIVIIPPALMQAIVRSPVVTLYPVIVNRSHKNSCSFILIFTYLSFLLCFVTLLDYFLTVCISCVSCHLNSWHFMILHVQSKD